MAMRGFSTIILALLLAGCGRSEAINGPANEVTANGAANGAVEGNGAAPPLVDNGYHSTVPPGNTCGYRTISGPCPGAPTRTCEQVVEGPPCPGPAGPSEAAPAAAANQAGN